MGYKITILGCGNSFGVPRPGNEWGDCDPKNQKNRRTRCSLLVQSKTTNLVVDTGQDFREQMNAHNVKTLDAVLYTHAHGDHVAGIDDVRVYAQDKVNSGKFPVYSSQSCLTELQRRYKYLFETVNPSYPALFRKELVKVYEPFRVGDIDITPHLLNHGRITALGYRFGNTAYSVDMLDLANDDMSIDHLKGINTWIVDAGGFMSSTNPVHASFERIFALNEKIGAKRVILTVLSHLIDYDSVNADLPDGFELAYDGLIL